MKTVSIKFSPVNLHNKRQKGSTLIVGMIFLLILTGLAVYSANQAMQQEKLSGHYIENIQSFNRTESLLSSVNIQLSPLVDGIQSNNITITNQLPVNFPISCAMGLLNQINTATLTLNAATDLQFNNAQDGYFIVNINDSCASDAYELSRTKDTAQYYWVVTRAGIESTHTLYSLFSVWGS